MTYKDLEPSTKVILKVFGAILILGFLWLVRDIIVILLLSVILASAMEPLAAYFKLRKVPRSVSVLVLYLVVIGLAGTIVYLMIPPVISQLKLLQENLPQYSLELQTRLPIVRALFGSVDLGSIANQLVQVFSGDQTLISRTVGVFNGVFTLITVLVISFYLVAEEKGMREFIKSLVPQQHQDFTMGLVDKVQKKMGLWVIGQIILSVSIFLLTWLGLTILGVKYALFLALIAGLLEVIPYIGPFLSAIPSILFAFIQSPPLAVFVLVLYIVIQKTEGYVLVPKVMQKTIGLSPLIVLVALLIGFKLAGILGLLLAVPLVTAIIMIIREFYSNQTSR